VSSGETTSPFRHHPIDYWGWLVGLIFDSEKERREKWKITCIARFPFEIRGASTLEVTRIKG